MEPLIVCALPIAVNKRTTANTADALNTRVFANIFINYLLDRFSGLCVRTAKFSVGGSGAKESATIVRRIFWYECSEKSILTIAKLLNFSLYSDYKRGRN